MKTLRGHPPRNISESGVIYLDSDGEDSDISDSDVEPVFFPAAGFDFTGDLQFELQEEPETDNEADSSDDDDESFIVEDSHDSVNNSGGGNDNETEPVVNVIQFIGGTVQVRHIVNENFAQLQQELRETHLQPQLMSGGESATVPPAVIPIPAPQEDNDSLDEIAVRAAASGLVSLSNAGRGGFTIDLEGRGVEIVGPAVVALHHNGTQGVYEHSVENGNPAGTSSEFTLTLGSGSDTADQQNPTTHQEHIRAEGLNYVTVYGFDNQGILPPIEIIPGSSMSQLPNLDLPLPLELENESNDPIQLQNDDKNDNKNQNPPRVNLKRKEPADSSGRHYDDGDESDEDPDGSGKPSRKALKNSELSDEDEEEETCNPMVSEDEEEDEEDTFRGDRIGSTVYSESHVLKILMKWVEALPTYSIEKLIAAREDETVSEEVIEKEILRLNNEFEEQMALLWDMSAETDVMRFLLENKLFAIIRDTIENSVCNRLIEVSLGILANVISEPSIIEDFAIHDASLQIVEKVVELCAKITDVAVLIQAYSVLRRIVWYLRHVGTMKKWTDLLLSPGFLECSNFVMSSSTNALLLGNVIILLFTFLDSLKPDTEEDTDSESEEDDAENQKTSTTDTSPSSSKNKELQRLAKNYEPFCAAGSVPALCEGLKELLKTPKPPNSRLKQLTSTRENPPCPSTSGCPTDEHCPNADEIDIPIPEGHVQQSILKGFSVLALLQKVPNGRSALKSHANQVIAVLLDFYRNFSVCTESVSRSNSLEYFSLSLHLLRCCHCQLDAVNQDAILFPVSTASKLINEEEKDTADMIKVQLKAGVEVESVSYVALLVHEYLASINERFGGDCASKARSGSSHKKLFTILDEVVEKISGVSGLK